MGKVEVRPSSLAEYDAFWVGFENSGSAIERDDLLDLLDYLEEADLGDLIIQDIYGSELVLNSELDDDYNEMFTLSIIKKEEVENTDEKQVFKKTKIASVKLNEEDTKALITEIKEELERF